MTRIWVFEDRERKIERESSERETHTHRGRDRQTGQTEKTHR